MTAVSPMEVAEAIVFVLEKLKIVQWGGFTLLATIFLRYGATPFVESLSRKFSP